MISEQNLQEMAGRLVERDVICCASMLLGEMLHEFPGLLDDETVINGGDIVQWLSIQVDGMEGAG